MEIRGARSEWNGQTDNYLLSLAFSEMRADVGEGLFDFFSLPDVQGETSSSREMRTVLRSMIVTIASRLRWRLARVGRRRATRRRPVFRGTPRRYMYG